MRLYIDKENIIAFMSNRNSDDDIFDESIRLIKKGVNVYYNFPKKDILGDQVLSAWFGRMNGSGVKFESIFCSDDSDVKPIRPLKSNFYVDYNSEDRSSVYLLNIEENIYDVIQKKQSILIGRPGDEMKLFKSLLDIDVGERKMCKICWEEYCPQLPLTDVIIIDNYYFKHIDVYKANNNELIRVLAKIPKDSINVVIFIKPDEVDRQIDLEEESKKIKDMIHKVSGLSKGKCAVTILTTNKFHSRHVITNYYRMAPTSCVHLKDNGLKSDANIFICPHSRIDSAELSREIIEECQEIANNPAMKIYGDKKSNYINFNSAN